MFPHPEIASAEAQNFYYSSWIPAAVHIACALADPLSPRSLAERLGLPQQAVLDTLARLRELGLVAESKGRLGITQSFLHLPKDSYLVSAHHAHWRNRAIAACQARASEDVHFTGVFALGRSQYDKIKERLRQALGEVHAAVKSSPREEELACVTMDAFRI